MPTPPAAALSTGRLLVRVTGERHLTHQLTLLPWQDPLLKTQAARTCPLDLVLPGRRLRGDDWTVTALYDGHDMILATCAADDAEARLSWQAGPLGALRLLVQLRAAATDAPLDGELRLSLFDHLHPGDPGIDPTHDPGCGPLAHDGRPLLRSRRYPLPHSWWSPRSGVAVLARYAQNTQEAMSWQPVPESLRVRLRPEWLDVCELVFTACEPGWPGVFVALRGQIRAEIDLSEYQRDDLAWYRQQWLHHFTFLYGREVFDHARGQLDVDRLLDDGRRFGGYDGVLLWPAYPRLGVDERSQWDFYDDLPGGRAGLRRFAERARARGTRVFIPYLPWDAPPETRHGATPLATRELARAVADVGADGVFLDTMKSVLAAFRQAIDAARPGVVFCSEGQPGPEAIARITGSWDQGEHAHAGEVDLPRFLFPEHPSFMINRHAVGARRERVIARARFNGTGLVVWQDVFGEVLPYTGAEAARVRATITLLRRYASLFRGADASPLVSTVRSDLYANAFIAANGRAALTVYNDGAETIDGDLVNWTHDTTHGWARLDESATPGTAHAAPCGRLRPGGVAVFVSQAPRSSI